MPPLSDLEQKEVADLAYDSGYEKCAHLYDLFDTKENMEFFFRYASGVGRYLVSV